MASDNALMIRRSLAHDHHRPRYHFLPPSNWMNDPNGFIQWQGQYHLFYQYNPNKAVWGDMHWGHAVSPDLVHWTDLPIGLAPTPGGPDEAGCYSGCAVDDHGVPTLVYTGTVGTHNDIQTQCLATSHDHMLTWQKYAGNPVLSQVPTMANQTRDFRDPFVWREGDTWYMVLGSRIQDVGGAIFLFRSSNLKHWEYMHPLLIGDIRTNGAIWECPNFFPLGDQWVLILSSHLGNATDKVLYFVGKYEDHQFTPTQQGVLDHDRLYAPLSTLDDQQRRVLIGWLREGRPVEQHAAAGWAGIQSIPRLLSLDTQHRLRMQPVPELEALRGQHYHYSADQLTADQILPVKSLALDIQASFSIEANGQAGLSLARSTDGQEHVDITYDAATQQLAVRAAWIDPHGTLTQHERLVPHSLDADELFQLRILLDGSVVEVIANERTSITSRIYPSSTDSNGIQVHFTHARVQAVDIWDMSSIW